MKFRTADVVGRLGEEPEAEEALGVTEKTKKHIQHNNNPCNILLRSFPDSAVE